jgi:hypothetical protein
MKITDIIIESQLPEEQELDEMPLPTDWDRSEFQQDKSSFKSRLAYALERAKKLGAGSSRVALTIEYEGRQTVLKIAKNGKGLAQNAAEASILDDYYASQMGILIPMIDYDTEHRQPLWIHTEMATAAGAKQLSSLMGVGDLHDLVYLAGCIGRTNPVFSTPDKALASMRRRGSTEEQLEIATDYANKLADLHTSFNVLLGDFTRHKNWGIYQGKPVIIDVGFTKEVQSQHYNW